MQAQVGDKVKLKGENGGASRGIVESLRGGQLVVRVADSDDLIELAPEKATNYSLAARKAWKNMPDRRVGRPKGARHCDRVSVTLRLDRELWERFKQDESEGLIDDRTAAINGWLCSMLDKLEAGKDDV